MNLTGRKIKKRPAGVAARERVGRGLDLPKIDYWKWERFCETEYQKMVIREIVDICGPSGKRSCSVPELELLGYAKNELIPALISFERVKLIHVHIRYPGTAVPFIFQLTAPL